MTNETKLKGRMVEKGYNLTSLAEAVKLSRPALRAKMTNKTEFRASEIDKLRKLLDISCAEVDNYFFCH